MSASFEKRVVAVRIRLIVGFILDACFVVPYLIPDFNGSIASQVLRDFIDCSFSVAALVCLAPVFLERFTAWQAIAAGLLMLIPIFALTTGLISLLIR